MELGGNFVGGYSINYTEVLKQQDIMAVTKLLVHRMLDNPYISVGDYLQELSDTDLDSLQNAIEQNHFEDVILISEMLATGEGCDPAKDFDEFNDRANSLTSFITIASLGRKGLVKVHYDKLSFHPDSMKNVIVEKIDGLDYGALIDKFK